MPSASTSINPTNMSRPPPKRAAYTWPGTAVSRNHFEDFLREIGASTESAHLCCVPKSATTHPHGHAHHERSTSNVRSGARSLSQAADKARASSRDSSSKASSAPAQLQPPRAEKRGRTLSSAKVSGNLTTGLPVSPKSPALSSIDLENHDAMAAYDYLPSARDSLLSFIGLPPLDERPSRAPTRALRKPISNASRSPEPQGPSGLSPSSSPASSRSRESEQHSPARSSGRSSSRSPSMDSVETASSSEAPATPKTHAMFPHELPPVTISPLEELERTSRFRVPCVCMTCKRAGANFPACGKCGDMWCSRKCRMGVAGTHACHGRTVSAV